MRSRRLENHWWLVFIAIGLIVSQGGSLAGQDAGLSQQVGNPPHTSDARSPNAASLVFVSSPSLDPRLFVAATPATSEPAKAEAESDREEAIALLATARGHERSEEFSKALQCYERALRRDPKSPLIVNAVIPAIVRIAARQHRYDEAARYVLLADQLENVSPTELHNIASRLTEQGEFVRAAGVYDKILNAKYAVKLPRSAVAILRMEAGHLNQFAGNSKAAAEHFAKVLEIINGPDEPGLSNVKNIVLRKPAQTYQLIGECFLAADRPEEARAAFEKAQKAAPDKAMQQFNLARVLLKTGKPAEALAALDTSLAEHLNCEDAAPYETLAAVLKKLGKSDELIGRLEKLRDADKNAVLGYFLASQYQTAGKLDKAEQLYGELVKARPMPVRYRSLFDARRQAKHFDALLADMGDAVDKIGVMGTFEAASQTVFKNSDAKQATLKAAESRLQSAKALGYGENVAAGLLALETKQHETADKFFSAALATQPKKTDELFLVWGLGLMGNERYAEAAKVFQRAIDERAAAKGNPLFQFYLSGALALAGQTDAALAIAQTIAERGKQSPRLRGRPAWVLMMAKRTDEAIKAYRALIDESDLDRDSRETRQVMREARSALSNLASIKGKQDESEEWLEQLLDEFPDDKTALNDLGYLLADQNKHLDRASRMIRAAVAAEPDNMAFRDSLGWLLFRQGKYAEAVAELEKAAADKKSDGVVYDHLGDAYKKAGQPDKAVKAWRKAAELMRKEKETAKAELVEKKIPQTAN
jgi:predicted Zn-dependent protease